VTRQKQIEIKMPWMAPDDPAVEVVAWLVEPGTKIEIDQDLVRLWVDGAKFILPSPVDGILREILVEQGEIISVGQVMAVVDLTPSKKFAKQTL
jgi:pyruvate/2-oxoglutarate dehydrogenase complex dihydrolipoamide acyltransferase (E2) component